MVDFRSHSSVPFSHSLMSANTVRSPLPGPGPGPRSRRQAGRLTHALFRLLVKLVAVFAVAGVAALFVDALAPAPGLATALPCRALLTLVIVSKSVLATLPGKERIQGTRSLTQAFLLLLVIGEALFRRHYVPGPVKVFATFAVLWQDSKLRFALVDI